MTRTRRPTLLLTNDDGIDTPFFRALLAACREVAEVYVAAPAREQSWIGKALSRHREVGVTLRDDLGKNCWAVDGTPADCVNIALGHLVPSRPDMVVSGINIGFNAGIGFILASGTVGGALEGALQGYPAVASSLQLDEDSFLAMKEGHAEPSHRLRESLEAAAWHSARMACSLLDLDPGNGHPVVHNLNFPMDTRRQTSVRSTVPAQSRLGSLYTPVDETRKAYRFLFEPGQTIPETGLTDLRCLENGEISHTKLDYSRLGR